MHRRFIVLVMFASAIAAGCDCNGGGGGGNDSGVDGGRDGGGGDAGRDGGGVDGGGDDGGADSGVTDPCAGSGLTCGQVGGGGGGGGFTLDGGSGGSGTGLQINPDGGIVLDSRSIELHFAWIANDEAGWVSKYDTVTAREVGRYYSVLPVPSASLYNDAGTHPSRTALDLNGDVWVANRSNNLSVGSVTKILNDITQCPDRNGNGQIDTSRDLNDSGVIGDMAGEFIVPSDPTDINQYDECVVHTIPLGTPGIGGIRARGLAVSAGFEDTAAGNVWVGMHRDKRLYRIDSATGTVLPANADGGMWLELPWGPYGLAVDSKQRLWVAGAPGDHSRTTIALVDTQSLQVIDSNIVAPAAFDPAWMYGIAIDGKDRVWLGAWNGGAYVYSYSRPVGAGADAGTWVRYYVGNYVSQDGGTRIGRTRGITVDDTGIVWIGSDKRNSTGGSNASQLIAIHGDDGGLRPFVTDAGVPIEFMDYTDSNSSVAIGVGLDSDGNVWINNYSGNVLKVNRDTGAVVRTPKQSGALYTYSDFTGYQLRHFTASRGTYRYVATGCGLDTVWSSVTWDAVVPPNTALALYVTPSNSPTDFSAGPRLGPYTSSPANLMGSVPMAPYLRLEFVLSNSDRLSTPELKNISWAFYCEPPIGERPRETP